MHISFKQITAVFLAVLFVLPAHVLAGSVAQNHAKPKLRNVELAQGGKIRGRVLDIHGRPVADTTVRISTKEGKRIATTNENGQFTLPGLRGGVWVVQVGEASYGARLWKQGTAPPKALKQFSVVNDPKFVVRGEDTDSMLCGLTHPQLLALALVAGGVVAIAVAANDDAS